MSGPIKIPPKRVVGSSLSTRQRPSAPVLETELGELGLDGPQICDYKLARLDLKSAAHIADGSAPLALFSGMEKDVDFRTERARKTAFKLEQAFPDLRATYNRIREVSGDEDEATKITPPNLITIPPNKGFVLTTTLARETGIRWSWWEQRGNLGDEGIVEIKLPDGADISLLDRIKEECIK